MGAPLIAGLKDPIPFAVFGIMALVCGIAVQMLEYDYLDKHK